MMVISHNRETAPSILTARLRSKRENSVASVVIFSSDHFVREEQRFLAYVEKSVDFVKSTGGSSFSAPLTWCWECALSLRLIEKSLTP